MPASKSRHERRRRQWDSLRARVIKRLIRMPQPVTFMAPAFHGIMSRTGIIVVTVFYPIIDSTGWMIRSTG